MDLPKDVDPKTIQFEDRTHPRGMDEYREYMKRQDFNPRKGPNAPDQDFGKVIDQLLTVLLNKLTGTPPNPYGR